MQYQRLRASADGRLLAEGFISEDFAGPVTAGAARWRHWYAVALMIVDLIAAVVATGLSYAARGNVHNVTVVGWQIPYALLVAVSVPIWLAAQAAYGSYNPDFASEELAGYRAAMVVGVRMMAVVAIASFAVKANLSRLIVLVFFPSLIVAALIGRWLVRQFLLLARKRGHGLVRMMLVGDRSSVRSFAGHLFRTKGHGFSVVGVCVPDGGGPFTYRTQDIPVLSTPDRVVEAARLAGVEAVAVANPAGFQELTLQKLAWQLERSGIGLFVAPDVADVAGPRIRVSAITGLPLLHITEPRIDSAGRELVAALSRVVAVPLTVLMLPVMAVVALAVLITSGRPILYKQDRIGYHQRPFQILKFRTMVRNADRQLIELRDFNEHDGALFKMRNDPRVTALGKWLRRFSLDEIPQLFNVVRGDMVFVGPRPVLRQEAEDFGDAELRRFLAKPGMTGIWQVSGRTNIPWEDAVKLDLYYVENWSLMMDLSIMLRTLRVVFGGTGY